MKVTTPIVHGRLLSTRMFLVYSVFKDFSIIANRIQFIIISLEVVIQQTTNKDKI